MIIIHKYCFANVFIHTIEEKINEAQSVKLFNAVDTNYGPVKIVFL